MVRGFWDNLNKPIIALAPMDGVTDAPYRYIMDTYGKPAILFTEFTSVEGICRGAERLLDAFIHHKSSTPQVAQIFGSDPQAFYKIAVIICELGYDGVDINMGCPDPTVAKRGGGAALILRPALAQKIIKASKQACKDWSEGLELKSLDLPQSVMDWVKWYQETHDVKPERRLLPVSAKTRIGYEEVVTEKWIANLAEAQPANLTLHGRTLKQLYSGLADWDEIAKAAQVVKGTGITLLGNGDVKSLEDAHHKIKTYGVDGVLIGRATYGNPWVFEGKIPTTQERLTTALEHVRVFVRMLPRGHFVALRKHMAWYCKGFDGAAELRNRLVHINTIEDVEAILKPLLAD